MAYFDVTFLYIAVSSPLDRPKRFTLSPPWQTCSFRHQLGFSGTHLYSWVN